MPDLAAFRATICGIDELPAHGSSGVTHLLSLLDPDWPQPEAWREFDAPARLDLRFHDIVDPAPGQRAPSREDVAALLGFGSVLSPRSHLLVHCHKGLSRSTAALALIYAAAHPDVSAAAVIAEVVRMRPRAWPNLLLIELGDATLGRKGTLVEAVAARYRARIAERPHIVAAMIEMGRARELKVAGIA